MSKNAGSASTTANCFYDSTIFGAGTVTDSSTGLATAAMKARSTADALNGSGRTGSARVWYTALDTEDTLGYPCFDAPATLAASVKLPASPTEAKQASQSFAAVTPGVTTVLANPLLRSFGEADMSFTPANDSTVEVTAVTDVESGFSTFGTTNANAKVGAGTGTGDARVDLSVATASSNAPSTSLGSTVSTVDLYAAAAYNTASARYFLLDVADSGKRYEVQITVEPPASKTYQVDVPVDAQLFELEPDGTVKHADAAAESAMTNTGAAPVTGSIASVAPVAKDDEIVGDFDGNGTQDTVKITDVLAPAAESVTLADSNDSIARDEGGMVQLGLKGVSAGSLGSVYFVPGIGTAGTIPLSFQLAAATGTATPLTWRYFMDYTGTYVSESVDGGTFAYKVAYDLALSADDVSANAASTTP